MAKMILYLISMENVWEWDDSEAERAIFPSIKRDVSGGSTGIHVILKKNKYVLQFKKTSMFYNLKKNKYVLQFKKHNTMNICFFPFI